MEFSRFHCICFYNYILFVANGPEYPIFIVMISSFSSEINLYTKVSPLKEKHQIHSTEYRKIRQFYFARVVKIVERGMRIDNVWKILLEHNFLVARLPEGGIRTPPPQKRGLSELGILGETV